MSKWAKDYVGIPFRFGGRDRRGLDCYGLVVLVYREQFGIELPDYLTHYGPEPTRHTLQRTYETALSQPCWQLTKRPRTGDVVLLKVFGLPIHCGLVVGQHTMLNTRIDVASCLERLDGFQWRDRVVGYFRYDG